jgi:hypothetical protein
MADAGNPVLCQESVSGLAPVWFFTGQMREAELKYRVLVEEKLGEVRARLGVFFGIVWMS